MAYKVAAIDIHKMVLIVAVAKAADEVKDPAGEALEFECPGSELRLRSGHI